MTDNSSLQGRCFCGEIRYEINLPTLFCGHCHCSMCRRPHGAGFVTWFAVPPGQIAVAAGKDQLKTYESSEHGRRQFCGRCGTQLFCYHVKDDGAPPDFIDITLATMVDPIDRQPEVHFFYDSKAEWLGVNDELPKLGGETGTEPLD